MAASSPYLAQRFLWDSVGVLLPFSKYWWNFKPWKSSFVFISSLWGSKFNMVWFHFMNATLNLFRVIPILSCFIAVKSLLIFLLTTQSKCNFSQEVHGSPFPPPLLAWVVANGSSLQGLIALLRQPSGVSFLVILIINCSLFSKRHGT